VKGLTQVITQWINFWVRRSPTLDNRWGGYFFQNGVSLLFMGSLEDAKSTFINEFDSWYYNTLNYSNFEVNKWGAYPPSNVVQSFNSWYDYKGGKAAYNNPTMTDQTGSAYAQVNVTDAIAARLAPQSIVEQQPDKVAAFLMDLIVNGQLPSLNYFLGGVINNVSATATSVHPGMRKAIWSLYPKGVVGHQKLRDFFPNNVTGVDFNHHYVLEPNWRDACWYDESQHVFFYYRCNLSSIFSLLMMNRGSNYNKLASLKTQYDPTGLFKCWHCIGYTGAEGPASTSSSSIVMGGGHFVLVLASVLIYLFV
jgi:hypothetical protein